MNIKDLKDKLLIGYNNDGNKAEITPLMRISRIDYDFEKDKFTIFSYQGEKIEFGEYGFFELAEKKQYQITSSHIFFIKEDLPAAPKVRPRGNSSTISIGKIDRPRGGSTTISIREAIEEHSVDDYNDYGTPRT